MKKEKNGKKPTKLLTALVCVALVVALVADILMFGVFGGSLDKAFPGSNLVQSETDESYANGLALAQTIAEEGIVLLVQHCIIN